PTRSRLSDSPSPLAPSPAIDLTSASSGIAFQRAPLRAALPPRTREMVWSLSRRSVSWRQFPRPERGIGTSEGSRHAHHARQPAGATAAPRRGGGLGTIRSTLHAPAPHLGPPPGAAERRRRRPPAGRLRRAAAEAARIPVPARPTLPRLAVDLASEQG